MNSDDINELKAEIIRLNEKILVMRGLLWEWNPTSFSVWEHPRLKQMGEVVEDYAHLKDNEPDMPLFDQRYDDGLWID